MLGAPGRAPASCGDREVSSSPAWLGPPTSNHRGGGFRVRESDAGTILEANAAFAWPSRPANSPIRWRTGASESLSPALVPLRMKVLGGPDVTSCNSGICDWIPARESRIPAPIAAAAGGASRSKTRVCAGTGSEVAYFVTLGDAPEFHQFTMKFSGVVGTERVGLAGPPLGADTQESCPPIGLRSRCIRPRARDTPGLGASGKETRHA